MSYIIYNETVCHLHWDPNFWPLFLQVANITDEARRLRAASFSNCLFQYHMIYRDTVANSREHLLQFSLETILRYRKICRGRREPITNMLLQRVRLFSNPVWVSVFSIHVYRANANNKSILVSRSPAGKANKFPSIPCRMLTTIRLFKHHSLYNSKTSKQLMGGKWKP